MELNIGKLDRRINFLKRELGQDDYGEPFDEWIVYKTVWASKTPLLGKEYFSTITSDTKVEVKFNSRFTKGITNDMRIRLNDEIYEIISAIDVGDEHKELLCYCRLVK